MPPEIFIGRGDTSGGAAKHGPDRRFQSRDSSCEFVRKTCQRSDGNETLVTPYEHANAKDSSLYQPKRHSLGGSDGYLYLLPEQKTREQPRSDSSVSTAPGKSLGNASDSSFEKKRQKVKPCDQSSHPCFSSRKTAAASSDPPNRKAAASNPPNRKDVSVKTLKGVSTGSNKTIPVIPIGPGFQAEIPVWIAPTKKGKFYGSPGDSDTLRWLGTGVWPTYSLKKKVHFKKVGEGRSDFCSCVSPRSTNCIKRHIKEARELLEKDIERAFYTWNFDQMGEEVGSKSWTAKEEKKFEGLVKNNPLSSSDGFWKFASKALPRKSEKDLISYYYNVFLIKRMRLLANSSADHIDSDDDHHDNFLEG